jgi:GNAT superfamily N-acetyltransferase
MLEIRPAVAEDAAGLAALFTQLGYPESGDGLAGRLASASIDPAQLLLVADDGGRLLGAAALAFVPVVHESRPWCRVSALVVAKDASGAGVGGGLMEAAERAAVEAGCSRIEATSRISRERAHAFYRRRGYATGSHHFLKRLG